MACTAGMPPLALLALSTRDSVHCLALTQWPAGMPPLALLALSTRDSVHCLALTQWPAGMPPLALLALSTRDSVHCLALMQWPAGMPPHQRWSEHIGHHPSPPPLVHQLIVHPTSSSPIQPMSTTATLFAP